MEQLSAQTENTIISYLSKYNPVKIGIFGSFARGEATEDSDIDLLDLEPSNKENENHKSPRRSNESM